MFPLRACVLLFCRHGPSQSRAIGSAFTGSLRSASGTSNEKEELKRAKTPQGHFDHPDDTSKDILQKFPDNVNPVTKEKGGPRGPEPTRYGDWERKGRCVDF
ncbi:unnamed protein product [Tetraodon nigroviridis]|uniref:Succinate dehydrogenase assembly factor 4, mitochondrial n=1 Tax=Tetraodon nigroviridis TaxID=99883 RepID=Q4RD07_TETNG|nr:unnamed protein product [Tetraodon nigroviridis]